MENTTAVERAVMRERWLAVLSLVAVTVACWSWIVLMARDMYGTMTGPARWMMSANWDLVYTLRMFAMWLAMMTGMMLPSAAPAMLLYARVVRRSDIEAGAARRVYLFAFGYLAVWGAFSAVATVCQAFLARASIMSPMMELHPGWPTVVVVAVAGWYQLTSLKSACLGACQSPAAFIVRFWRPGALGALQLGALQGVYCLGCCWGLMLLLFAGGVMNLTAILAITVFVLAEKLVSAGAYGRKLSGALLLLTAVWVATRQG